MRNSEIWFNGKAASEYGVRHIEAYPEYNRPERKADVFEVPGRSGSVVFMQDAWNEIEKQYDIYCGDGERGSVPKEFYSLSSWLNSADGYGRLEDTYEPEIFRLAYCLGAYETENAFNRHGRATITFNCRPEHFLKTGAVYDLFDGTTGAVRNPTAFTAKPLFRLYKNTGAGDGTLTVVTGGKTYEIDIAIPSSYGWLYIDCETMHAYGTDGADCNSMISCLDFPKLAGNEPASISITSGYDISIMPRWFYI